MKAYSYSSVVGRHSVVGMTTVARAVGSAVTAETIFHPADPAESCVSVSSDYRYPVAFGMCCSPGSGGCFSASVCSWAHTHQLVSPRGLCPMNYQLKSNIKFIS